MAVKLIALDIDGTLLDSRWTLPEAKPRSYRGSDSARHRGGAGYRAALRLRDAHCYAARLPAYHDREQWSSDSNARRADAPAAFAAAENSSPRSRNARAWRDSTAVIFDRAQPNVILEIFATDDPIPLGVLRAQQGIHRQVVPLESCLTEDPPAS